MQVNSSNSIYQYQNQMQMRKMDGSGNGMGNGGPRGGGMGAIMQNSLVKTKVPYKIK